ncbi:MAG: glycosyltransferase family 2 protein [Clostridiales bacterium]|nr:glycosyltransferase family 2 protein [Clostridiales bacterium]
MHNNRKNVGVVIPAYNEEACIGSTIRALKDIPYIHEILVVDDGSSDNTAEIAKQEGARLLKLGKNYGKGYAVMWGIQSVSCPIILLLDADLGESAGEAVKLIRPIHEGRADVTIARFAGNLPGKGFGLVKGLARLGVRMLTGKDFKAVLSGQRGFRREVVEPEFFRYKGFGIEFGMTVDLLKRGVKICEVDVQMTHSATGMDWPGMVHRARQFRDIMMVLLRKVWGRVAARGGYEHS